jgi:hypothetical protein
MKHKDPLHFLEEKLTLNRLKAKIPIYPCKDEEKIYINGM